MRIRAKHSAALASALVIALAGAARAEPDLDAKLVINGDLEMTTIAPAPAHLEGALGDNVISGWHYRDAATRQMETDDFENPAMSAVDEALAAWDTVDGSEGKSCADCHGAIEEGMKGVTAVLPKVTEAGALWSAEDFINDCRTNRMGAEAWDWDKDPMKNMTAAIALQSRGMPVNVAIDGAAAPFWEQGKEMYYTRYGLLQLSCANCHEQNNGNYIRADHLSQGQINGFPVFRLKNDGLVSIHNRFAGCVRDTRAETFSKGGPEFHALELYVASRGNGLAVEGPSVRP
ncbi:MAG: sulfur oxidation c-type cytochrome SoxA [Maritimibacter sp.]|nr:sulfur oxidation c-type cytochrome SoxA [Maritimibacter sp.]